MAASFVTSLTLQFGFGMNSDDPSEFAWMVLITVSCSTVVWLAVTFFTGPESEADPARLLPARPPERRAVGPHRRKGERRHAARDGLST